MGTREQLSPAVLVLSGRIERGGLPELDNRLCRLLGDGGAGVVRCDVQDAEADAVTVDALARLALVARRNAGRVRICRPSDELRQLVALMGLSEVLGC